MTLGDKIKIAEKRIADAKTRRMEFANDYKLTGNFLSKELAQSETELIQRIEKAICAALLTDE